MYNHTHIDWMMGDRRSGFHTKLGGLLAAAGSAVGLGNIWRFPTETGEHGGAAFMLIYIVFMLLLGVPVMIAELAIGRHGGRNVSHSFAMMSGHKMWGWMGVVPVVSGVMLLSYYSVVAGWTLEYFVESATNVFGSDIGRDYALSFQTFSSGVWRPIICLIVMLLLTAGIVACGVKKGIERASIVMMPVLLISLVVLAICSFTLPGAKEGLLFFVRPDFSMVDRGTILSAIGQAFFSLSVGVLCLCTYGCYFRKDADIMKESLWVACCDAVVAILAGLVIFPAVFSASGVAPDAGPGLVFITLPSVFQQVFSLSSAGAYLFSLIFYFLLVVAALTSMISMLEMSAAIFVRKYHWSRPVVCALSVVLCGALGAACSMSFGAWSNVTICGMGLFELFDYVVAKVVMPLSAIVLCVFIGWIVAPRVLRDELTNGGTIRQPLYNIYCILVRYIAPVGILLIFMNGLGLF